MPEIDELLAENAALRERIGHLEREIEHLRLHPTIASGFRGETLVAQLTEGTLTPYAEQHDLLVGSQVKIEVKFSKLNTPNLTSNTRRWNWGKPLGLFDQGKEFDFLVLVGEKDWNFPEQYLDSEPYVYILLHNNDVAKVVTSGKTFGANIQLTTNFSTVKSAKSKFLISRMVPARELKNLTRTPPS